MPCIDTYCDVLAIVKFDSEALLGFVGMDMDSGGYPFRATSIATARLDNRRRLLKWITGLEKYVLRGDEKIIVCRVCAHKEESPS